MNDFNSSKIWSDKFISEIKRNLGEVFIDVAPFKDDTEYNTDLILPNGDGVSCRIRSYDYWERFRDQFTIRTERPSGAISELEKICDGYGRYIFYGFANREGTGLVQWFVGDLDIFRNYIASYKKQNNGNLPGIEYKNLDKSSLFRAFKCSDIPDFIIARSTDDEWKRHYPRR